jgi:hypothetical protein
MIIGEKMAKFCRNGLVFRDIRLISNRSLEKHQAKKGFGYVPDSTDMVSFMHMDRIPCWRVTGMAPTFQSAGALVQILMGKGTEVDEWFPKSYRLSRVPKIDLK